MKWFRHETDARQDFKLKRVQRRFGMEGLGVYWSVIELLAFETKEDFNGVVKISLESYPIEDISSDFGMNVERLREILQFMADVSLIDKESFSNNLLCCMALAKRADDYSIRVARNRRKIKSVFGDSPEINRTEDITREDKKKTREDITTVWNATRLPKIITFSKERNIKLAERMQSEHFRENWREAIRKLAASSFACGGGKTGWKADINWFLANDTNYVKALEGKYDGKESDIFAKY